MPAVAGRQPGQHRDHDRSGWPRTHASRSGPTSGRVSRPSEPAAADRSAGLPLAAVSQHRAAACTSGATITAFERMQVIFPAS